MPVAWVIAPYRAGERSQVRALALALAARGFSVREIELEYRPWAVWPHVRGADSLAGLRPACRDRLHPPWPDVVVSSGVRNEPVCRWIRAAGGGHTRYVHVGKPWAAPERFDLVVTTPQYRVPDHPQVLNNDLTLHALDEAALEGARARWQGQFAGLPRPWTGVLVGGNSGPFTLGERAARSLLQQA